MAIEITDEVAQLALSTYCQAGGNPRAGMRKAIEAALPHLPAAADPGPCPSCAARQQADEMDGPPGVYAVWRDALLIASNCTPLDESGARDFGDVESEARKYARLLRTCAAVLLPPDGPGAGS